MSHIKIRLPRLPVNVTAWSYNDGIATGIYTKPKGKNLAGKRHVVGSVSDEDGTLVCEVNTKYLRENGGKLIVDHLPSGLVDLDGREIFVGDKIRFIAGDPLGRPTGELGESLYEVAFEQGCVVAKYLSGGGVEAMDSKPLRNYMETKEGRYISNYGPLTEYPNNRVYCRVIEPFVNKEDGDGDENGV